MKFRRYFQKAVENSGQYIEQGKLLYNNNFIYIHPYDMECCFTAFHIFSSWDKTFNDDDEWVYMRSRMMYLDSLFLNFEKNKDFKFLDKVIALIDDFINCHTPLVLSKSTRTLDTGIRMVAIVKALLYLKECDYLTTTFENKAIKHLESSYLYLEKHYISKYDASNWGFMINCGIYSYAWYVNDCVLKNISINRLISQLSIQIDDLGLHWEKSHLYHLEIMIYLSWVIMLDNRCNQQLLHYLKLMADATKKLYYPNGEIINFGDSDVVDVSHFLVVCDCLLLQESTFPLSAEVMMFCGDFCDNYRYKKLEYNGLFDLSQSGYIHLRNNDFSVSFYNTSMSSSHTHLDLLHLNYYLKKPIFVDGGRYSYCENQQRYELKDLVSHNTIQVFKDSLVKGSWEYFDYPVVNNLSVAGDENIAIMEGSYYYNCTLVRRRIAVIEDNVFVFDSVFSKGEGCFSSSLKLHPDIIDVSDDVNMSKGFVVQDAIYSEKYNCLSPTKMLVYEKKYTDSGHLNFSILNKSTQCLNLQVKQNNKVVDDNVAMAFEIKTEKSCYILAVKHEEIFENQKCLHVDEIAFVQNIQIYQKNDEKWCKIVAF